MIQPLFGVSDNEWGVLAGRYILKVADAPALNSGTHKFQQGTYITRVSGT